MENKGVHLKISMTSQSEEMTIGGSVGVDSADTAGTEQPVDVSLLEVALTKLVALLRQEARLLHAGIQTKELMGSFDEKTDLITFLEWQRSAIIEYLKAQKNQDLAVVDDVRQRITSLIQELSELSECNMEHISQRKFLNEKFVEMMTKAVEQETRDDTYSHKKITNKRIYINQTPHIVFNENA
ncbi:hypothetical protein MIDIC_20056 [Alphaproteobacteria bacterium]